MSASDYSNIVILDRYEGREGAIAGIKEGKCSAVATIQEYNVRTEKEGKSRDQTVMLSNRINFCKME
jgi:hypothetical protein